MDEESDNKELEEYLDKIGIPKNEISSKEIINTITFNSEKKETIFLDQNGKEIDYKNIVKDDSANKNFSFFKKGTLLSAKSHYSQVLLSDSQGNLPKSPLVETDKNSIKYPSTQNISLHFGQQVTVLEEGFIKVLDGTDMSLTKNWVDALTKKDIEKQKVTKTIILRYIKFLSLGKKTRWFDEQTNDLGEPLILYAFFDKDVSKKFLHALLFESNFSEQEQEDIYLLKIIDHTKYMCLYPSGFGFNNLISPR